MRYRITVNNAGAVDPLREHHLAQLVAWWACRAPVQARWNLAVTWPRRCRSPKVADSRPPLTIRTPASAGVPNSRMRVRIAMSRPGLCRRADRGRPVAQEPAEGRADRERGPLQEGRREGQAHGVEVRPRDHGEPERVRQSPAVRLALAGEREHRLDHRLEPERGPHLAEEPGLGLAGVPEAVRRPWLDGRDPSGARDDLLIADSQADRAFEHLEAFGLVGVDVRRGDEPAGADDRLDEDRLAVGLAGRAVEDENLASRRVLEPVSVANHGCPFVWPCRPLVVTRTAWCAAAALSSP